MTQTPPANGPLFIYVIVAVMLAQIIGIGSLGDRRKVTTRIERLEHSTRDLTSETHDLRARVLRLERPDEPVHPPRHPGRIGGKPVIPWVEPWSGSRPNLSRPTLGTESGNAGDQPIGTIDRR